MTRPDDVRALLDPLAAILAARPRFRTLPQRTITPPATPELPDPDPIVTPARVEAYVTPADMPPEVGGDVSLGTQLALVQAALAQLADQRVVHTSAAVIPPALPTANVDIDVTTGWTNGTTQTVPALVSIVPVGPGPLQQRAVTATVTAISTSGVTVRFRAKRPMTGLSAWDVDDRYVINAIYEYTPPFVPEAP